MEPITHALSGAVIGYALPGKRRWWLPAWAALVAASPDMDVFFTRTPLQYIEYHRGITHSFVGGLGLALLLALIPWLMNRWRVPKVPDDSPPFGWPLPLAWLTAYLLILHHIFLDCMNSYGTQVFLPFSDYRVRLNALFIVDPLLLLPLALGLIFWRKRRAVMIGLLLWTILYPLGSLATRVGLEAHLKDSHYTPDVFTQELLSEDLAPGQRGKGLWDDVRAVHLVPDAFTPFHWKLILDRGSVWDVAGYTVFTEEPQTFIAYAKPPQPLWAELAAKDRMFRAYERFALYPALEAEIPLEGPLEGYTEYVFSDLRFGSTIGWVDDIQVRRHGKPTTFRIMARVAPDGRVSAVRFITTTGAGGDSGWNPPVEGKKKEENRERGEESLLEKGFPPPSSLLPKAFLQNGEARLKGVPPFSNQQLPASEWLHVSVVSLP